MPGLRLVEKRAGIFAGWKLNLAITLPFLVLYAVDLYHHQMWRDELNAWAIAASASSLRQLFALVHYEAHPWLWYAILYLPSRFTSNPIALKWTEALFGTAIYLVIGMLSPFTRVQKILIFLSYFVVFEYTVMSRMYSVMFLCALLYVAHRARQPDSIILNSVLIGLVASTDMTGVLLSGAMLIEYVYDRYTVHRRIGWTAATRRDACIALLLYVSLLGLAIATLIPAHDISWNASGRIGSHMFERHRMLEAIGNLTSAPWWPISGDFPRHFWNTDSFFTHMLLLKLTPFVLLAMFYELRRNRGAQLMLALTLLFGMLFFDIVYWGSMRHWGITFVAFLLAIWLEAGARLRHGDANARRWSFSTYGLMGVSAVAGVTALVGTWTHPFSEAANTARWIRAHNPADVPLVGRPDYIFASVGEELQRPMYFMECDCFGTFKLFSRDHDPYPSSELPARLNRALDHLHTARLLFLDGRALKPEEQARLRDASLVATPVAKFDHSESYEDYFLYDITRASFPPVNQPRGKAGPAKVLTRTKSQPRGVN